MLFYRQCTLKRGIQGDIAWIPEKFAVEGKYLRIKKDGVEEDGWQVVEVSSNRVNGDYLKEHERNYLTQREASDI